MMVLFAGLLVLLAVMAASRWFAATPPAMVLKTARWTGALLLGGAILVLAVTGRLGWALAGLAALIPWLMRLIQARHAYRAFRAWSGRGGGVKTASSNQSRVETRFLRMSLDHDSGVLSGEVRDGPFAGRPLSQLSFAEAFDLYRFCGADPQSVQLLESWLDRTWPDWRAASGAGEADDGRMTREEACRILGLSPDADRDAIKEAHHRLMVKLHPDHGGSTYLAAKINQAKDFLLK
ncbi:DnaJ domain-containing protein [Telmatospirillum siberiense]|uniref:Molecular chaperone DnaJ n=1 Tax=Telmatospirillum siberiense TaxID=382514 RepID=A0A2N3PZR2_9PROT|nr:DnaJ domain-containing protein [Telmatospirillum siberiense]PKU25888.1 molecular chaperone DnaJ [Telmatospirillum siberiense]